LEKIRLGIEHLADISTEKNNIVVKTNFHDKVMDIRGLNSDTFIDKASIKTELQKVLEQYIQNLYFIKELEKTELITNTNIDNIKHNLFNIDKIIEDKANDNEELKIMIKDIISSSNKQVANNILDNFIQKDNYTQKQIEVMIKIKNIIFGKTFMDIHSSINNIKDLLMSDLHPISDDFDILSEDEQDDIIDTINLIDKVELA
jgi:hypothetical protein